MLNDRHCQKAFGQFIRDGRESKYLHQTDVAEAVGVSQQYYSTIETGKRNVDFVLALRICQALNLNLNLFIETYLKENP